MKKVRIGAGAGFAGDRIEPAIEVMEKGDVNYIVFECLAERTIGLAQLRKSRDPEKGYDELLKYRMEKAIPICVKKKIRLITNMGAANPQAAASIVKDLATDLGIKGLKIATVLGDDILNKIHQFDDLLVLETGEKVRNLPEIISANAYLGAEGILEALSEGADIVITGRVADPSLFVAPILLELGGKKENYDLVGTAIVAGHLLECGAQATGGYFADPGYTDVPDSWKIGFPIAEVNEDGDVIITKVEESGGIVSRSTCTEQLLYEIHDPSNYVTPDGIADFSNVTIEELLVNKVRVRGARARKKPESLKVCIGYKTYIVEAEISYGGSGCLARAEMANENRQKEIGLRESALRRAEESISLA